MVRDIFYKLKADDRENRLFLTDDNTIYLRLDNGYEILLHSKSEETYIECRHNSKSYVNYRISPDSMFEELSAYMEGRKAPPTNKKMVTKTCILVIVTLLLLGLMFFEVNTYKFADLSLTDLRYSVKNVWRLVAVGIVAGIVAAKKYINRSKK